MAFFSALKNKVSSSNTASKNTSSKQQLTHDILHARYAQTLDNCSTAIMMADADLTICYVNTAVVALLTRLESQIRKELPNFAVDSLIGQNIDIFHKHPQHQRKLLANLKQKYVSSISIGEVNLELTLIPMFDDNKQSIGTMVEWVDQTDIFTKTAMLEALDRSQAVIEFSPNGVIKHANENFLNTVGYSLNEIQGKHHQIFVPTEIKDSAAYKDFWQRLDSGEFFSDEFKRITKTGQEIWLSASYNPIFNAAGKVISVVKYATNITEQKLRNADFSGQIDAISKSQAVIEFNMDGTIITANEAFLATTGYSLPEITGKHHSMFAEPEYANSHEYKTFWQNLNAGEFSQGEFKRKGKHGEVVWLQASYNPILDLNGKPFKVVKYASDISARKIAVNEISRVLMLLSQGDLTANIEVDFGPEFQELGDAISQFITELRSTISELSKAASAINSASREIAQGNSDLSTRTEQQASSLEETASTMEELTSTVQLNSQNTNKANKLASSASEVAVSGGSLISEVVTTMASINDSAGKISDIIGVIDGIAFQTNILALNAAVEAARAGEQGRGFAVVASEVRTLAQRSANAAKDIKTLISDSVGKIAEGDRLVGQSGSTMNDIVHAIKNVTNTMVDIDAATSEQSASLEEVSKAIIQMDDVTQQNAALVEQAAAASESMLNQSEQLAKMVNTFRLT
ncbi:MAG: methyl-accepting chemotaxis protein [Glaciecola sp.]